MVVKFVCKNLLFKVHSTHTLPFYDSVAGIDLTANPVYHARTKHIKLDVYFIMEKIAS